MPTQITVADAGGLGLMTEGLAAMDVLTSIIQTRSAVASAKPDLAAAMRIFIERAQQLCGADGALIDLLEPNGWICRAGSGIGEPFQRTSHSIDPLGAAEALASGTALCCDDAQCDPRANQVSYHLAQVRSVVTAPFYHQHRAGGVLRVLSRRTGVFSEQHVIVMRLMADLLGWTLTKAAEHEAAKNLLAERTEALDALQVANNLLRASEEEYRATFELAAVGRLQIDLSTGSIYRVNQRFCQTAGYSASELGSMVFSQLLHPYDISAGMEVVQRMLRSEISEFVTEARLVRKNGKVIWVSVNAAVIYDAQDHPARAVATVADITQRKQVERLEQDRGHVLEMVAKDLPLGQILGRLVHDLQQRIGGMAAIMVLQDGIVHLHGPSLPAEWREAISQRALRLAADLSWRLWESDTCGETTYLRSDPAWQILWPAAARYGMEVCWTAPINASDTTSLGLLTMFRDDARPATAWESQAMQTAASLATICVEHNNTTRQLSHLVRHDILTGLANRLCLQDHLQQAMAISRRSGRKVALFVLDLDHFKQVNDTRGHDAGDALLQLFGRRLLGQLRETDTLARVGGDEFMIVLPELPGPEAAVVVAQKLMACLQDPFDLGSEKVLANASMGIAIFPDDAEDAALLQKRADEQMYVAKRKGRNGFSITAAAELPAMAG